MRILVTTFFILNPIFALYGTGFLSITLLDAILISLLIFHFVKVLFLSGIKTYKLYVLILPVVFSVIFSLFINSIVSFDLDVLTKSFRYLLYLFSLLFLTSYFDLKLGWKILKYTGLISCIFLLFQYFCLYFFEYYPPGYIPGLKLMREELIEHADVSSLKSWFRPRSFFGEPSQFGIFNGVLLFISLHFQRKIRFFHLFLSFSLIASFSGTAFFMLVLSWSWRIFSALKKYFLLNIAILGALIFYFISLNIDFSFYYKRLIRRLESFDELFFHLNSSFIFFGHSIIGRSRFENWPNSFILYIYYFGIFGLLVLITILLYLFVKGDIFTKKLVVLIFALSLGTEFLVSQLILLIFPLLKFNNEGSLDNNA